jgi:hypothetical protein
MRFYFKFLLSAVVLLALEGNMFSQTQRRYLGSHGGYISISADKSKTELGFVPVFNSAKSGLFLYASFSLTEKLIYPDLPKLEVAFISVAKRPLYIENHDITIIADNSNLKFLADEIEFHSKQLGNSSIEAIGVRLAHGTVLELLKARNVKVVLGGNEFHLAKNHLAALKDLSDRINNKGR